MDNTKAPKQEQIRIYLDQQACEIAAQLRAAYAQDGEEQTSLGAVVTDALELLHYQRFQCRGVPPNWRSFLKHKPRTSNG